MDHIEIKGARANNLRNISLRIPRGRLVVVTGVSGSGKSSLAFDTLYAEGQRRYVESLSAYARQFLGRMSKPECDVIKGIPPAIAIEQKVGTRNPRSTVGTTTEVYDYMRLLFARVGKTISPVSGQEVKRHTAEDVVATMLSYGEGTRFAVLCPLRVGQGRTLSQQLELCRKNGYARVELGGDIVPLDDAIRLSADGAAAQDCRLVVDRLSVHGDRETVSRLTDDAETAFFEGGGEMMLRFYPSGLLHTFSSRFEADGITFEEPNDRLFAFNSPLGACPECEGFGSVVGIDEGLVIPNTSLSVYDGCVMAWRGEKMNEWREWFIRFNSPRGFPIFKPYYQLTQEERDWLWHGTFPKSLPQSKRSLTKEEKEWGLVSVDAFFQFLKDGQYKIQNRVMLARYRGKTLCPKCHGRRLRPEAGYVQVGGRRITDLVELSIEDLKAWFDALTLTPHEQAVGARLLTEIRTRLAFLLDVGLPYLTLARPTNTLSGGESQRIRLATSLGSALVGSLYILDEPSIGLHPRDTERLIRVLRQLRDMGNTVVVVEHDEDIMRSADWIIDIGPDAGTLGGQVVWQGAPPRAGEEAGEPPSPPSHTLDYLTGRDRLEVPQTRRPWNNYIEVRGARANNLRGINVRFPLNVLTVVTGVSGSGKSTLVRDILYRAMKRRLDEVCDRPGEFLSLEGDMDEIRGVEFVDQNPIGRSTRSNPVTYVRAWDDIRRLFALQPLSRQMGYGAGHFSFNTDGGRCEECKGEGTTTVEMQFMADLVLTCESCHGQRFKSDILEVRFEGKNVNDVLNMTVDEAIRFFRDNGQSRIALHLQPLQDVGLGYIRLGQSSSTLSGGENQRVKLAYYLGKENHEPTLFIFDEPTTGLHFHDIKRLLEAFHALLDRGHTIVVIEHNMEVVRQADHVVDLGPEGGNKGGNLVAAGTPEAIAQCEESHTGRALRRGAHDVP